MKAIVPPIEARVSRIIFEVDLDGDIVGESDQGDGLLERGKEREASYIAGETIK